MGRRSVLSAAAIVLGVTAFLVPASAGARSAPTSGVVVHNAGATHIQTAARSGSRASIRAKAGPTRGGTRVVLTAPRFRHVKAVTFGARTGTKLRRISSRKLSVLTPAHRAGTVTVRVIGRHHRVQATYRYRYASRPRVTTLSTHSGSTAGGRRVTLTGRALTGASRVLFGTSRGVRLTVVSASKVRVTTPRHAAGTVSVRVITPGGKSRATTATRFRYATPSGPSDKPTSTPTSTPTSNPTSSPTDIPTDLPSGLPTGLPTDLPSVLPTDLPTDLPSILPTDLPSILPTDLPSILPTDLPSILPTDLPSILPTDLPSILPTDLPSILPTDLPSILPTGQPTLLPSSPTVPPLLVSGGTTLTVTDGGTSGSGSGEISLSLVLLGGGFAP